MTPCIIEYKRESSDLQIEICAVHMFVGKVLQNSSSSMKIHGMYNCIVIGGGGGTCKQQTPYHIFVVVRHLRRGPAHNNIHHEHCMRICTHVHRIYHFCEYCAATNCSLDTFASCRLN